MKKINFLLLLMGLVTHLQAQVGINTTDPLTSLHVVAKKTDNTSAEGIIAPKLTRAELIAKMANNKYTTAHVGTFVYITDLTGTPVTGTNNITAKGYYYFDGTYWQRFSHKNSTANNGLTATNNNIQLGGGLVQKTTINAGTYDMAITGTGKVGIGTATPSVKLDVVTGGTEAAPITGFRLADGSHNKGSVLLNDGDGNATWGNIVGNAVKGSIDKDNLDIDVEDRYLNMYINVPPGNSQVYVGGKVDDASNDGYITMNLVMANTAPQVITVTPTLAGFPITIGGTVGQAVFFVNNPNPTFQRLNLKGKLASKYGVVTALWVLKGASEPFIFVVY